MKPIHPAPAWSDPYVLGDQALQLIARVRHPLLKNGQALRFLRELEVLVKQLANPEGV